MDDLRRIIDTIPVILIITDKNGFIRYANKYTLDLFGYNDISEFNGYICKVLFGNQQKTIKTVKTIVEQLSGAGDVWNKSTEISCVSRSSRIVWVRVNIQKIFLLTADSYLLVFTGNGIPDTPANKKLIQLKSHKKKLAPEKNICQLLVQRLKQQNAKLAKISRMKDNFLMIASHDLRSPLCSILGFSEILKEDGSLNDRDREIIDLIYRSSENLLNYIDDLLLIAKMNRSSLENISREWEIDELVNEVIKTTELTRIMKGITIRKTGISFKCIGIDRTLILQILFNLVSNAIKFSHPHSSVHIFIERVDEAYCVHVIDKGVGIPNEEKDNVFLEWHKVMPFGTTGEEGNGVGLAMCKNLVQSFGGTIGLKSEYQSGSDFYFTIPD